MENRKFKKEQKEKKIINGTKITKPFNNFYIYVFCSLTDRQNVYRLDAH